MNEDRGESELEVVMKCTNSGTYYNFNKMIVILIGGAIIVL